MNIGYCTECSEMVGSERPFEWGILHSLATGHWVKTPHDRPEEAALRASHG